MSAVILAVLVSGCTTQTTGTTTTPSATTVSAGGELKEFDMMASNWQFDPSTITVDKGDTVRLRITSTDVKHGFALPDFNVSKDLNPGETVTVEFVADKAGEFTFFCNVFCGEGHSGMKGKLVVVG